MAGTEFKLLEMAVNGLNGWKGLEVEVRLKQNNFFTIFFKVLLKFVSSMYNNKTLLCTEQSVL